MCLHQVSSLYPIVPLKYLFNWLDNCKTKLSKEPKWNGVPKDDFFFWVSVKPLGIKITYSSMKNKSTTICYSNLHSMPIQNILFSVADDRPIKVTFKLPVTEISKIDDQRSVRQKNRDSLKISLIELNPFSHWVHYVYRNSYSTSKELHEQ